MDIINSFLSLWCNCKNSEMKKVLDYLILVLIVGLMMIVSSCEKELLEPDDVSIVIEEEEIDTNFNPIEYDEVDPFLSTPAEDAVRVVNVVVLNYIPSKDQGVTLDQHTFPFRGDNNQLDMNLSVEEYKKWLLSSTVRVKHGVEEGSRLGTIKGNLEHLSV